MARHAVLILTLFACYVSCVASPVHAALPSDQLLPNTTKGYVSVQDADELSKKFEETQLGQLIDDPLMKPFIEDLKVQMKSKLTQAGVRVGLTMDDVKGVRGGEIALATIQPGGNKAQHATAFVVDVTGHAAEAQALIEKSVQSKLQSGGKRGAQTHAGVNLVVVTVPQKDRPADIDTIVYVLHKDQLIATDHVAAAQDIVNRLAGGAKDSLSTLKAYDETMKRVRNAAGDISPHIRWFVEPIGYSEVSKASIPAHKKKRGRDLLKVLTKQGFDAVKGLGGFVTFKINGHELEHRTFVYAPPVNGVPANEKYRLAARMLNFPNNAKLAPLDWVPRDLSVHLSFNMKIKESFEYVGSLVDELADAPNVWDDILRGLIDDPLGPQVDLRKELVAYAGDRATLLSDYRLPITPKSERLAVAIEVTNEAAVAKAIGKIMKADPNAHPRDIGGRVVWEIINDDGKTEEIDFQIEGAGFTSTNVVQDKKEPSAEEKSNTIPNSAVTVVHGHLLVATHLDFIKELLNKPVQDNTLGKSGDFNLVDAELAKLGAKEDSFRFFSRTDESYRPTYELLKQGKMPESETMFGKLLNRLFDQGDGQVRDQQIDGSKMPDYQAVRRYLGPAGFFVHSEADGWSVTGCLLTKEEAK